MKTNLLLKRKTKDKMSLGALLWRSMKCFTGSCLLFNCKHSAVRFLPIMGSFMQKLHLLWCSCNSLHLGGRSFLVFLVPLIWSFPCDFLIRGFFNSSSSVSLISCFLFMNPWEKDASQFQLQLPFEMVLNSYLTHFFPSVQLASCKCLFLPWLPS